MNPAVPELSGEEAVAARVQAAYQQIARERMADLPLNNPKLGVHSLGFRVWEEGFIGILITPWCMNLISLPGLGQDWSDKPELTEEILRFPSGSYRFTVAYESAIGTYRMCSLFSPMFAFADDAAAIETAQIILQELFNASHRETADIDTREIRAAWQQPSLAAASPASADENGPSLSDRLEQPVSRRALFRGGPFRKDPPA